MSRTEQYLDDYEIYEEQFNPLYFDRQARRQRKPKPNHQPKKTTTKIVEEIADTIGLEGGFQTTYEPSRYESTWLLQSLENFYNQELISDVLAQVKGGKEASVYRCAAHPATGQQWLAAKVYRPRMFRNLRNDRQYRQGRPTLDANGKAVNPKDARMLKAIGQKTSLGEQVAHTSWLMYEYTTLQLLYKAGAAVPKPIAAASNAILMQFIGGEFGAAPTLVEVTLDDGEAEPLFQEVIRNVELMLQYGRIHGDLSAYNILYWDGQITLIDFPQVVNSHVSKTTHVLGSAVNPDAYTILERDVTRVCEYFARYGVNTNPARLTADLWQRFAAVNPEVYQADLSRLETDRV